MAINTTRDLRQTLLSLGHFFVHESCGKCFPCRLGTQRQLEIMEKVASRKATREDIAALEDIGYTMTAASLCGLGMTAGSAILSALKLWPEVFVDSRT
jgi:NADH-quinone oxidoreductase subunit F